jgi:hypothetical protein
MHRTLPDCGAADRREKSEEAMTARKSGSGKKPKVEKLELNKETVQDLSEREAEGAMGAMGGGATFSPNCTQTATENPGLCHSKKTQCLSGCGNVCKSEGPCATLNCTQGCGGRVA